MEKLWSYVFINHISSCITNIVRGSCTVLNIHYFYIWQTAIPILIGTKFDDFAQLPLEMQWTIVNEVLLHFIITVCCDQNIDHLLSLCLGSRAFCISNVVTIER
jgi:hypothetical protein